MSLETEIYTQLSGYSGMSALVGSSPARIYPVVIPQNSTMPAMSYQRISSQPVSAMGADTAAVRTRVQVSIFAENFSKTGNALAVRDKVVAALTRYRGGTIQDCFRENEQHDFDSDPKFYRIILDFIFWHTA